MNLLIIIVSVVIFSSVSGYKEGQIYSYDGRFNNRQNKDWGAVGTFYKDEIEPEFEDGISVPINSRPLPRYISNTFMNGPDVLGYDGNRLSLFELFFGQFVNHDQELGATDPGKSFFISTPDDDDFLVLSQPPGFTGFNISYSAGVIVDGKFKVINQQTSWFDLSPVYGTSEETARKLRGQDGKLLSQDYHVCGWDTVPPFYGGPGICSSPYKNFTNWLPSFKSTGAPIDPILFPIDSDLIFTAGDPRVEENIFLSMIHLLWLRSHNHIAEEIKKHKPNMPDDHIYHEARRLNIAIYQHILFDEYLPSILDQSYIKPYNGYDKRVDPGTSNIFATAAFRYGHSSINVFETLDVNRSSIVVKPHWTPFTWPVNEKVLFGFGTPGPVGFTSPELLYAVEKEENLIYTLVYQSQSPVDQYYSFSFRNLAAEFIPADLASIDIARGRITGIPNYYELRKHFYPIISDRDVYEYCEEGLTLDPIECFEVITTNTTTAGKLRSLYGKVRNIDGIVGLLTEDKPFDHIIPPSISNIIFGEYNRKRTSDRLWYENQFNKQTLDEIKSIRMKDLLELSFDGLILNADNPFIVDDGSTQVESRKAHDIISQIIVSEIETSSSLIVQISAVVIIVSLVW